MKYLKTYEIKYPKKNLIKKEEVIPLSISQVKDGDYVKLNPKAPANTLYTKITYSRGKNKSNIEIADKLNDTYTIQLYKVIHTFPKNSAVIICPIYPLSMPDFYFSMQIKDLILAEDYEINSMKYNL